MKDYHGTGNVPPILDKVQNWELVENGTEIDGITILKFKRLLDTCDLDNDIAITVYILRLILTMSENTQDLFKSV